jgi:hypothetical protein
MASIAHALEVIKQNPLTILNRPLIEQICRDHGYQWRDRELDPATTIALFAQQIMHGNAPCAEVPRIARSSFTGQAYCDARARLPLSVYQDLFSHVCEAVMPQTRRADHRWHGHRTFLIDGSTFSMPDTPQLRKAFGTPSGQKPGCGFPVAHLLVLFNAQTGLLLDAWASRHRTSDLRNTPEAHLHLNDGDIVLGDDTFSGYAYLASLAKAKLHGLFPVHHLRIVDFKKDRPFCGEGRNAVAGMPRSRWIKSLGKEDQLVEYFKPYERSMWMSPEEYQALPESIVVRELRRTVTRPGLGHVTLTMVTTLLDPKAYPASDLLELRLGRWEVETNIGHLKTTMGMDVLHCKTEQGVRKELAMFCLVYNMVRAVMLEASRRQQVPVSRVSFADALNWMRHARPGDRLPDLVVNPWRPNRVEPRCRKRRPKEYDLMTQPRKILQEKLRKQAKNA